MRGLRRWLGAWLRLRWRLLRNTLRGGLERGGMDLFTRSAEIVAPLLVASFGGLGAICLGLLAFVWGWALGAGGEAHPSALAAFRILAAASLLVALFTPNWGAGAWGRGATERLLLLPVPRRYLFAGEVLAALANPWVLAFVPGFLLLPLGIAITGAWPAACVIAAGGLLQLSLLGVLGVGASGALELLLRRRNLWELLVLVTLILSVLAGALLALIPEHDLAGPRLRGLPRATFWLPSEALSLSLGWAVAGKVGAAWLGLLPLGGWVVLLGFVARLLWDRALEGPQGGAGSAGAASPLPTLPGVGASGAVAALHLRQISRTVRGRVALLFPSLTLLTVLLSLGSTGRFAALPPALPDLGPLVFLAGIALSALMLSAIAQNQLASDGGGLALLLLQPLSMREILRGKAVAHGMLVGVSALLCLAVVPWILRDGHPLQWMAAAVGALGSLAVHVPLSAVLSSVFPRSADLSRLGRAGNAHPASELLAALVGPALFLPAAGCVLLGGGNPWIGLGAAVSWAGIGSAAAWLLFQPAVELAKTRMEAIFLASF